MINQATDLHDIPKRLQVHATALGHLPRCSLKSFIDLGLSDSEIGRYFKIPETSVSELKEIWKADQPE